MIRIATRASALARWQAEWVATRLRDLVDDDVGLVLVETTADRRLDVAIDDMGGKGVFVKEIQAAVLDGRADIAVHSAKDLPSSTPQGLSLVAVPERADPRDVLVGAELAALARGAHVATGSNRRRVQLAAARPDLRFSGLRGNIATRLGRLDEFDAIVMAKAALDRLELTPSVVDILDPLVMVPQVGQGALAIECRAGDALIATVARLQHGPSRLVVDAERAFLAELGGDCTLPAGAHAQFMDARTMQITGVLASSEDSEVARGAQVGTDPEALGTALAVMLRDRLAGKAGR